MTDMIFTAAKGRIAYFADLPGDTDSFVMVPLSAVESNGTLQDYATLSEVFGGSNVEQTDLGRLPCDNVTVLASAGTVKIDADDVVWGAPTSGDNLAAMLLCYKPAFDSPDFLVIPLVKYDFIYELNGEAITAEVNSDGLVTAI